MHCFSGIMSDSSQLSAEEEIECEIGMFYFMNHVGKQMLKRYVGYTSSGLGNKYSNHHNKRI